MFQGFGKLRFTRMRRAIDVDVGQSFRLSVNLTARQLVTCTPDTRKDWGSV